MTFEYCLTQALIFLMSNGLGVIYQHIGILRQKYVTYMLGLVFPMRSIYYAMTNHEQELREVDIMYAIIYSLLLVMNQLQICCNQSLLKS